MSSYNDIITPRFCNSFSTVATSMFCYLKWHAGAFFYKSCEMVVPTCCMSVSVSVWWHPTKKVWRAMYWALELSQAMCVCESGLLAGGTAHEGADFNSFGCE